MPEWLQRHLPDGWTTTHLIWASASLFVVMLVGSLVVVAWAAIKIPPDYFASERAAILWKDRHPLIRLPLLILKNLIGVFLVLLGIVLSLPGVPGQGILTILLGAMLMDFPGRRSCERWLLTRRGVLNALNKLRARYKKPPIYLHAVPDCKPPEQP